jgi:PAS domain S-box-containing protein
MLAALVVAAATILIALLSFGLGRTLHQRHLARDTRISAVLRENEQRLRESESRYRLLADNAADLIVRRDIAGKRLYVSPSASELIGYEPDELMGVSIVDLVHPEDVDSVRRAMAELRVGAERSIMTYRARRKDGSYVWAEVAQRLIVDEQTGEPREIISVARDISERKAVEDRLKYEQERFHDFALSSSDWFWEQDADLRFTYVSETAGSFGHESAMFLGKTPWELEWQDVSEAERAAHLADLMARRPFRDRRFKRLDRAGRVRHISISGRPVFDGAGAFCGYRGTARDVTHQIEAEAQRRELEEQLHHLQKLEALGQLAGGVAHELNNALVPVLGMTKVVMGHLPTESRDRALLGTVVQGAQRARELVNQILAFSRKEAPQRRPTALAGVVGEAMKMLRASLPSTIRLRAECQVLPTILGDPDRLHQVIINLVTNAAQAIGVASGQITVTLHQAGEQSVRLSIADTGCGIDPAIQHRIFEPFFTTKEVGKGTGLGLSVVHGIINSHGGTIAVVSNPGEGTRFDITLPLASAIIADAPAELSRSY